MALALMGPVLHGSDLEWDLVEPSGLDLSVRWFSPQIVGHDGDFYFMANNSAGAEAVYLSGDNGESWREVANGIYFGDRPLFVDIDVSTLLLIPEGGAELARRSGEDFTVGSLPTDGESAGVLSGAAAPDGTVVLGGARGSFRADPAWWVSTDGGESFRYFAGESRLDGVDEPEQLTGMAYGNGIFVAVGYPGEVWTSEDGVSWNQTLLPEVVDGSNSYMPTLHAVEFVDGLFYAVGDHLTAARSSNGTDWESLYENPGRPLTTILRDGDNWHAGGERRQAVSSDGGQTWVAINGQPDDDYSFLIGGEGILYSDRYFAATGQLLYSTFALDFPDLPTGIPAYTDGVWLWLSSNEETLYRGSPPASFLDAAADLGDGWYEHPWLGRFAEGAQGWFYHAVLGWVYSESPDNEDVWLMSEELGWIHTDGEQWPYFYHADSGEFGQYVGSAERFYNVNRGREQVAAYFGEDPWVVSQEWLVGKTLTITDAEGTHTVVIESVNGMTVTVNTADKVLEFSPEDTLTWFDSGFGAGFRENQRFTIDLTDATMPGVGDRILLILTFDDANGGSSQLTYSYLSGFFPVRGENIMGTFVVE